MESKKPGPPQNHQNLTHFLHDLAQPLATVTGLVDLLLLETDERDKTFHEIRLISEQLEKIITIIEEIRRVAQDAAARQGESHEPPESFPS